MTVIYVLLCIICAALTGLVLIQDSKSGGLGGITGSSTMASLGANTDKTIVKITGVCAFLFFALILMTHLMDRSNQHYDSLMGKEAKKEITESAAKKEDSTSPIKTDEKLKFKKEESTDSKAKEGTSVVVPIPADKDKPKVDAEVKSKAEDKADEKKSDDADKKVDEPKKEETPK